MLDRNRYLSGRGEPVPMYCARLRCKYTYSAVGALNSKTHSTTGAVTTYDYDSLRNLSSVQLPDGRNIEYEIDASNRRIGKRVNAAESTDYCTPERSSQSRNSLRTTRWSRRSSTPRVHMCPTTCARAVRSTGSWWTTSVACVWW